MKGNDGLRWVMMVLSLVKGNDELRWVMMVVMVMIQPGVNGWLSMANDKS